MPRSFPRPRVPCALPRQEGSNADGRGTRSDGLHGRGGRGRINVDGKTRTKESWLGGVVRGDGPVEGSTGVNVSRTRTRTICGAR